MTYAGDVSPREAWEMLEETGDAILVDVRTLPEWQYVGLPDLTPLGRETSLVSWQVWPGMGINPNFVDEVAAAARGGPLLFICRSGRPVGPCGDGGDGARPRPLLQRLGRVRRRPGRGRPSRPGLGLEGRRPALEAGVAGMAGAKADRQVEWMRIRGQLPGRIRGRDFQELAEADVPGGQGGAGHRDPASDALHARPGAGQLWRAHPHALVRGGPGPVRSRLRGEAAAAGSARPAGAAPGAGRQWKPRRLRHAVPVLPHLRELHHRRVERACSRPLPRRRGRQCAAVRPALPVRRRRPRQDPSDAGACAEAAPGPSGPPRSSTSARTISASTISTR